MFIRKNAFLCITNKDYEHAQKVFEEFKLINLVDCHDLYV